MYNEKDMFCDPEPCPKGIQTWHLLWTYTI